MNILKAVLSISARELTRRVVWLLAYAVTLHRGTRGVDDADQAVEDYERRFPKTKE